MRALLRCHLAACFAGLLCAVTMACAIPAPAQTLAKPDAANLPQSEAQAAPKRKPSKAGAWHHFGDSDNVSVAAQGQSAVWHHFGPNDGTSEVSPDASAPKPSVDANRLANLERQMWVLVNHDRLNPETFAETSGRAQPLKWNESLAVVAHAHSRNMLEQRFFSHVDPDGRILSTRIDDAGIPWRVAGENIAIYETVLAAEAAFMNEPRFEHNHRANILNASFTDVGIGIVQGPKGSLYITQDFVAAPPNRSAARKSP